MSSFKVALIQAAAVGFDLERGLEKVARLAGEASAGGAALAVFPEAFLPAYPRGITFGTVVGDRTPEGRDQFRRYFDASVDVPGPAVDRLAGIAADIAPQDSGCPCASLVHARPRWGRLLLEQLRMGAHADKINGFGSIL